MDNTVKIGVYALGGLAVVGAILTVFKSSSSSPPSYPESQPAPAQEYNPPQDLPGGMERESEHSEDASERGSVGGRKSKRKLKSKRIKKKRSKRT